ncbi:MAG: ACT domain-containing protein [Planctomycetes bacterium]|nr:ACT domain-containing protein [Planctomycetota bacterium]
MKLVRQFSVSLVNRPGVLANICRALSDEKVNIMALTISDSIDLGLLRIVVDKNDVAKKVLSRFDAPVTETDVLAIDLPNRPGAMAVLAEKLSRAHININYAYVTTGVGGGQATAFIKVQYPDKVMKVLNEDARKQERKITIKSGYSKY